MKVDTTAPTVRYHPTDEEIREKSLELYVRSGWLRGRDLENWLEAEAFLVAHGPDSAPLVPLLPGLRSHSPRVLLRRLA